MQVSREYRASLKNKKAATISRGKATNNRFERTKKTEKTILFVFRDYVLNSHLRQESYQQLWAFVARPAHRRFQRRRNYHQL